MKNTNTESSLPSVNIKKMDGFRETEGFIYRVGYITITNKKTLLTDSILVAGVFTGHHLHPSGLQLYCFLHCGKRRV